MNLKKVLSILLVAVMLLTVIPFTAFAAETTVTWTASEINGIYIGVCDGYASEYGNSFNGITVNGSGNDLSWMGTNIRIGDGTLTFTSSGDNISSIVISAHGILMMNDPTGGWSLSNDYSKFSWSGTPAKSVTLSDDAFLHIDDISQIEFTLASAASYTVTWQDEDGRTLETDTDVAEGTTPTYDGATPTKATDEKYMYFFS